MTTYLKCRGLIISAAAVFTVAAPLAFVFAQVADVPAGLDPGRIESALKDLSAVYGQPVNRVDQAKAICNLERFMADCAEIGKRHDLFDKEETVQVDTILNELKGRTVEDLKRCSDETCLVEVANRLARDLSRKSAAVAKAVELTPEKISEKKAMVEAAKEVGVGVAECQAMDPDAAPVEMLRACAKLAKHKNIQRYLPAEAKRAAIATDKSLELKESLSRGEYQCGDNTIEGCGNYCLNPGAEARADGTAAIPPVCLVIAEKFFGSDGVKDLEAAYSQVYEAASQYERRAENVVFTTPDGRTINDPAAIGRYLESEGSRGNVEAVSRGMDYLVIQGFVKSGDRDFAIKMVERIRSEGREINFDACGKNPETCQAFIPEEHKDEFEAIAAADRIMREEMARRGVADPVRCESNPEIGEQCAAASRSAITRIESTVKGSPEAQGVLENIRKNVELTDRSVEARRRAEEEIRNQTNGLAIGDRTFRSFNEMDSFCRENGTACLAEAARRGIVERDYANRRFERAVQIQFNEPSREPITLSPAGTAVTGSTIPTPTISFPALPRQRLAPNININKDEALKQFAAWLDNPQGPPPIPFAQPRPFEPQGFEQPGTRPLTIPICPSAAPPRPCAAGEYREEGRDLGGCQTYGACVSIPGFRESRPEICPALPTVDQCPAGQERVVNFSSPGCGTYYGCRPITTQPPAQGSVFPYTFSDAYRAYSREDAGNHCYTSQNRGASFIEECKKVGAYIDGSQPPESACLSGYHPIMDGSGLMFCLNDIDDRSSSGICYELYSNARITCPLEGATGGNCPDGYHIHTKGGGFCMNNNENPAEGCLDSLGTRRIACPSIPAHTYSGPRTTPIPAPLPGSTQCSDGRDNDADGLIDYPADTGCYSREDFDESFSGPPVPPVGVTFPYRFSNSYTVNTMSEARAYCMANGPGSGQGIAAECETKFGVVYGITPPPSDGRSYRNGIYFGPTFLACMQRLGSGSAVGQIQNWLNQNIIPPPWGQLTNKGQSDTSTCEREAGWGMPNGGGCLSYSTQLSCQNSGCTWYANHYDGTHCDDAAHGQATGRSCMYTTQNTCNADQACEWNNGCQTKSGQGCKYFSSTTCDADAACKWVSGRGCGVRAQCNDGRDNDSDGLIDYPSDTGCFEPFDNDETSGTVTPPPPTGGQREQVWNSNGLRSWIRSDADSARIEQLKQSCASVPSGANVWMPGSGSYSSPDFGMPDPAKCRIAASCTSTQYFDGTACVTSGSSGCSQYGTGWHVMSDNNCYDSEMRNYRTANGTLYSCSTTPASGCSSTSTVGTSPQCSDGRDNDADGQIDYPADTGCYSSQDNDEMTATGTASCRNYTAQSSCQSAACTWYDSHYDGTHCDDAAHGQTSSGSMQCSDGRDNDGDGQIDYPADTGCYGREDNDETTPAGVPPPSQCPSGYHSYLSGSVSQCISDSNPSICQPMGGGATYTCPGSTTTGPAQPCPSGQYWNGTACVNTSTTNCTSGQYWNGTACVYSTTPTSSTACNYNNVCDSGESSGSCPTDCGSSTTPPPGSSSCSTPSTCFDSAVCASSGWHWYSGGCWSSPQSSSSTSCSSGYYWNGSSCVSSTPPPTTSTSCPSGSYWDGSACAPNPTPTPPPPEPTPTPPPPSEPPPPTSTRTTDQLLADIAASIAEISRLLGRLR